MAHTAMGKAAMTAALDADAALAGPGRERPDAAPSASAAPVAAAAAANVADTAGRSPWQQADGQSGKPAQPLVARIVAVALLALVLMLCMIGSTLWLAWRLEGAAAAINDTGSLRMQAHRIAVELLRAGPQWRQTRPMGQGGMDLTAHVRGLADALQQSLQLIEQGDAQRPLLLPRTPAIQAEFARVQQYWQGTARPAIEQALHSGDAGAYLAALPELVLRIEALVAQIEQDSARKTTALNLAQGLLLLLAVLGTLAMIYLLYRWIVAPVMRLREGLQSMAAHQFGTRLAVQRNDEFGLLAAGYNQMADELQSLYQGLEQRVAEKTARLAAQNHQIGALYDMAAFLNQPNDIEAMCEGFLQRVMAQFEAQGASIRTLDAGSERLSLVTAVGLSSALTEAEHCMRVRDCHCGQATLQQQVLFVRDLSHLPEAAAPNCRHEGFASVAVFRIVAREAVLGSFSLHFRGPRELQPAQRQLLQSLGQLLGVALENRRLDAKARELAVVQERSLVAQGLHDSLAQGLNFLNLQLQLLEDAVRRQDAQEVDEILPLLRTGVEESYQDVRELLSNFRSKLEQGDFCELIEDTVQRFRRQSGCEIALELHYAQGAPLAPEQQLQVLFLLQEALSNVRKHAQARRVCVRIDNARDFTLDVQDDGQGYDPEEVSTRSDAHVGMRIMRERAARMNAHLLLDSAPGAGARVRLTLPASERQPA
ncbi:type IV pili methyl-accepting chemotaxis transducer N-terminal domain-containing protein [Vandammella animalimorsus]|nr:type IV pili methyl-accepting chemotaxis transducer N-terminal domain-containing protein [Vandammella animalimorsus]